VDFLFNFNPVSAGKAKAIPALPKTINPKPVLRPQNKEYIVNKLIKEN
jgi:hypothetical protein